ncbi:integral membrane protein (PIN domain superfamily) [Desulfitobacterium dehalogenans ATCC 51507]|uniref:Integral membrane protein (PIN domain superfamily) n=2 Tax=Desulfitobacterium dehalogenans TaxID=36854 RepID=I4A4I0_DESDJ|nr:PIN/TRAM domain-containing protein [Desulfitobacterium dehalogenans]AFL98864.1 integral membrane protein (PIN domain superfamily) [Desulfitobacterium dehalogenans ATCC 51507]
MIRNIVRVIITVLSGAIGFYLNVILLRLDVLQSLGWQISPIWTYVTMVAVFAILGFLIAPASMRGFLKMISWFDARMTKVPINDLIGGAIGVIIGLIIASLLSSALRGIPVIGSVISIILSVSFGYLGLIIGVKRKEEVLGFFTFLPRFKGDKGEKGKGKDGNHRQNIGASQPNYKILDTSVIIDGRIADIVQTGFLEGTLLIPGFVLEELQHIADSSDLLKRNRGRRGLDILNQISKEELANNVEIMEIDFEDISEVDSKLVRLGQNLGAPILTNDYNLNKVAELQGVKVLNINELANAVKPIVLPGEEMEVQVMKEGKEPGQGVAYLDDGTMIVVDTGRRYMGQTITVLVTSVLQTAAGRMIFAKPKALVEKKSIGLSATNEVNALG